MDTVIADIEWVIPFCHPPRIDSAFFGFIMLAVIFKNSRVRRPVFGIVPVQEIIAGDGGQMGADMSSRAILKSEVPI